MSRTPDIEIEYSQDYKRINVAGIYGGIIPGGVEAIVYSEERRAENVLASQPPAPHKMSLKRTIETQLLIDPMQMKAVHQWLGIKIKEYENLFGIIPSPEEVESKSKRRQTRDFNE